jgi:acyl-CoA synthetase (AMP-forming)/AMP-acid ligase II
MPADNAALICLSLSAGSRGRPSNVHRTHNSMSGASVTADPPSAILDGANLGATPMPVPVPSQSESAYLAYAMVNALLDFLVTKSVITT